MMKKARFGAKGKWWRQLTDHQRENIKRFWGYAIDQSFNAGWRAAKQDWQPIDAAPKDQRILLWVEGPFEPKSVIGRWNDDRYANNPSPFFETEDGAGKRERRQHQPTYFMLLAEKPK